MTARNETAKSGYDNYKLWSPQPDPATIARCPVCNSSAEVWQYAKAPEEQLLRVVMCTNGEAFGPQDGLVNEGCLLYMPPDGFYRATTKEAVRYWNDYAKALTAIRSTDSGTSKLSENDKRWRALEHCCMWVSFCPTGGEAHSFDPRYEEGLKAMRAFADEIREKQLATLNAGIEELRKKGNIK